jgi:effector-binding domain-containing protein
MLKKILFFLAGIVILLLAIGFILPAKLDVSRNVSIHAPTNYVFEEINNLERWEKWQYWNTLDPETKITYGDIKVGTGASYFWDGPKLGKGSVTITESITNKSIALDLKFTENSIAKGIYSVEPDGENTLLNFNFSADQGLNPIARWFNVFMKGEIEKSFEYAGEKIKEIAEAKPVFAFPLNEETVPAISYVGLTHIMSPKDQLAVNKQMEKMYTKLAADLKKANVKITGSPFCIYPKYSEESMEMVCAMPVSASVKVAGYQVMQTEAGRAVKGVMHGDYSNLQNVHNEIQKYIKYKNLIESGAPREVYITDPMLETDTSKWITEVYYPVKEN